MRTAGKDLHYEAAQKGAWIAARAALASSPAQEISEQEDDDRAKLIGMLARASQMINDWCVSYASDMCHEKDE